MIDSKNHSSSYGIIFPTAIIPDITSWILLLVIRLRNCRHLVITGFSSFENTSAEAWWLIALGCLTLYCLKDRKKNVTFWFDTAITTCLRAIEILCTTIPGNSWPRSMSIVLPGLDMLMLCILVHPESFAWLVSPTVISLMRETDFVC